MSKIKCATTGCEHNNKRLKYGCSREADPHTCKGYLVTVIGIMEETIISQAGYIEKKKKTIAAGLKVETH